MSIAWLVFTICLFVSFISAMVIISACVVSAQQPERAPQTAVPLHKWLGVLPVESPMPTPNSRLQNADASLHFSPFGL